MATMAEAFKMQTTDQPSTEGLRWKTRIAVLWLIYMGNFAAYCIGIASGQVSRAEAVTNANMITLAVFFLVPSILAWLSLTLKDAANRWMNFVFGILFSIPIIVTAISPGVTAVLRVKSLADFLLSLLIVWYAWKWPKQKT